MLFAHVSRKFRAGRSAALDTRAFTGHRGIYFRFAVERPRSLSLLRGTVGAAGARRIRFDATTRGIVDSSKNNREQIINRVTNVRVSFPSATSIRR